MTSFETSSHFTFHNLLSVQSGVFLLLHHSPQEGSNAFHLGSDSDWDCEDCGLVMREITYALLV